MPYTEYIVFVFTNVCKVYKEITAFLYARRTYAVGTLQFAFSMVVCVHILVIIRISEVKSSVPLVGLGH